MRPTGQQAPSIPRDSWIMGLFSVLRQHHPAVLAMAFRYLIAHCILGKNVIKKIAFIINEHRKSNNQSLSSAWPSANWLIDWHRKERLKSIRTYIWYWRERAHSLSSKTTRRRTYLPYSGPLASRVINTLLIFLMVCLLLFVIITLTTLEKACARCNRK